MRLLSLCPSLTELVFDLGRGGDLVGRTRFCIHPAPQVDRLEKLGGTKNPKLARIIELAPDLVLLNEEENRREDWEALRAAGIACHVSFPRDVPQVAAMVRAIAAELERPEAGERIARDIEQRAERVRRAAATRDPLRYAYLIWRDPWMVASGDTFVSAMLGLAGGVNAFDASTGRYPAVSPEDIARAAPDRVFLSSEPFPFAPKHADELAAATGLPRDRFVLVDGELLSWHGSRTAPGIDYANSLFAGG